MSQISDWLGNSDKATAVCYPLDNPGHPCMRSLALQVICQSTDWDTQQKCFCSGDHFHAWRGCIKCAEKQEMYSPDMSKDMGKVISEVSSTMCDAKAAPTVRYDSLILSVLVSMSVQPRPTGVKEEIVPVSEYYTAMSDVSQFTPEGATFSFPEPTGSRGTATAGQPTSTSGGDEVKGDGGEGSGSEGKGNNEKEGEEGTASRQGVTVLTVLTVGIVMMSIFL